VDNCALIGKAEFPLRVSAPKTLELNGKMANLRPQNLNCFPVASMKNFCAIVFLFCVTTVCGQARIDSLIGVLKHEISKQDEYTAEKLKRIEEWRGKLAQSRTLADRFVVYNNLYHAYKTFVNDSAYAYAQRLVQTAQQLNDETRIGYAHVKASFITLSAGLFKETFDTLKVVRVNALPDSSRFEYYRLTARTFADLMIYNKHNYFRDSYNRSYRLYMDSALRASKPESYNFFYLTTIIALHENNFNEALENSQLMVKHHTLTHHQRAVYHYDLAEAWQKLGEQDKALENLILSSISDLRGSVRETAAMYTLARMLHQQGDSQNAYIFIQQALKDAEFYGARQRQVEINSILPLIAYDQFNAAEEKRKRWFMYSMGITIMVVLVVVFSIIIYKQLKKLREADAIIKQANYNLQEFNQKLIEAQKIKEEYIGYYFNMTTDYINKIDALRKQTMNLLVNDKKKDALSLLGSYNPQEERAKFIRDFDKAFLRIFPDFVHQFNLLIDPKEPLVPEAENDLNADLRIFALIRLGVQDNKKIGEILNFSVNTIYAYKTRVKSKSVVPDDVFLKRVMAIKSVDNENETNN
jgi:hypothetical protein